MPQHAARASVVWTGRRRLQTARQDVLEPAGSGPTERRHRQQRQYRLCMAASMTVSPVERPKARLSLRNDDAEALRRVSVHPAVAALGRAAAPSARTGVHLTAPRSWPRI
eukprot:364599-Chlamydomonas_euryale.AAC.8